MIGMEIMVPKFLMDLKDCFVLEDILPKSFADYEEWPYGIMFYNTHNKDSYDSNQITRLFTGAK